MSKQRRSRLSKSGATQSPDIGETLKHLEREHADRNPLSLAQHRRAEAVLPAGHTRQTLFHTPFPLTMIRGNGARLWDLDQHEYLDMLSDFTACMYGHSDATIHRAVQDALDHGLSLGGVSQKEAEFAELICNRIPSIEQVRFCNSGTEACLFAVTIARAVSGRPSILAFNGAYHGGFMVYGDNDSPLNIPGDVFKCTYNDIDGTRAAIRKYASSLAAIIVEPMMGSAGAIPGSVNFLRMLREETERHGVYLIFDEVMSSRLGPSGVQGIHGIRPDLTTLGKFWGGGFGFGAFGGSRAIMRHMDTRESGTLSQAGTFNNNIMTMSAGLAAARDVFTPYKATALNELGDSLRIRINSLARSMDVPLQVTGLGSVMNIHFHLRPITSAADVEEPASAPRRLFHLDMLRRGVHVAQRGLISFGFAHTQADLDFFVQTISDFMTEHRPLLITTQ